ALFAFTLVAHGFVSNGIAQHLLFALRGLGADAATALIVGGLIGPAQVLGRLADLLFGKSIRPLTLGLLSIGSMLAGFAILLLGPFSMAAMVGFALFYGIGNGLITIAR